MIIFEFSEIGHRECVAQAIKSDKIAFYACALKLWQSHNLTVDDPVLNNFKCNKCIIKKEKVIFTKDCPGCGVKVEKTYGCNHIHCSNCDVSWCWECENIFHSDQIYNHMWKKHGRIFDNVEPNMAYIDENDDDDN